MEYRLATAVRRHRGRILLRDERLLGDRVRSGSLPLRSRRANVDVEMRVLVTGSNGFLGFEVARRLAGRGESVIAFDTAIGPHLRDLAAGNLNVIPVVGDIADLASLAETFKTQKPDAVLHFAAIVGVVASLRSPSNVLRINVQGSLNVLEAMRLYGVRRVIHLSTEEVYGDFQAPEVDENHPQMPLLPYGITKLTAEHFGRAYRTLHGLDCINVRCSWIYGVRLDRPRPPMNYLKAALTVQSLHVEQGADTVIDYTYVDDAVEGILLALDHRKHRHDVYNIASGQAVSDRELVEEIRALIPGADIVVGPGRRTFGPGIRIPVKGALNCARARDEFGYVPRYDIRQGLRAYIEQWRKSQGSAQQRVRSRR